MTKRHSTSHAQVSQGNLVRPTSEIITASAAPNKSNSVTAIKALEVAQIPLSDIPHAPDRKAKLDQRR
jgi:hypothetical protein